VYRQFPSFREQQGRVQRCALQQTCQCHPPMRHSLCWTSVRDRECLSHFTSGKPHKAGSCFSHPSVFSSPGRGTVG
jgi:hypothetical protein